MIIVEWRIVRRVGNTAEKIYLSGSESFDTFAQARTFIRSKLDQVNLADICKVNFTVTRSL